MVQATSSLVFAKGIFSSEPNTTNNNKINMMAEQKISKCEWGQFGVDGVLLESLLCLSTNRTSCTVMACLYVDLWNEPKVQTNQV
jgi:hypothetical protein